MTTPTGARSVWASWRLLFLLHAAYLLSFVDRSVMSLLVEPVKRDLGLTDTQIGLLQGVAFGILYTLLGLVFGWLADRTRRTTLVSSGVLIWSLASGASGLAVGFPTLFAARMAVGVGEASLSPAAVSLIADAFAPPARRRALGLYQTAAAMGVGLAMIGGGVVSGLLTAGGGLTLPGGRLVQSWRVVFLVLTIPGLLLAYAVSRASEPIRAVSTMDQPHESWRTLLDRRGPVLIPYLVGFTLLTIMAYGVLAWTPSLFGRLHHWTVEQTGLRYGVAFLTMGVGGAPAGAWLAGKLARHRRAANLLVLATSALGLALVGIAAPLVTNSWVALALFGFLAFLFAFPSGVSLAVLQDNAAANMRGRLSAFYFVVITLAGTLIGPLAVGVMTDHVFTGPSGLGYALATLAVATAPLASVLFLVAAAHDDPVNASSGDHLEPSATASR